MIMVAMSYFCRQNVSQISLEIVANCSHPSEILDEPCSRMIFQGCDGPDSLYPSGFAHVKPPEEWERD